MFGSLIPWREGKFFPTTSRFEEEMDELMNRLFRREEGWLTPVKGFVPKVDLVETENEFNVTLDLPGMKPEEVNVELKNGDLWITGERKEEKEEEGKTYHRIERRHGEFRRVLSLPTTVDEDKIEAKFENGMLKVTVPKTEESKTKHIEIKS